MRAISKLFYFILVPNHESFLIWTLRGKAKSKRSVPSDEDGPSGRSRRRIDLGKPQLVQIKKLSWLGTSSQADMRTPPRKTRLKQKG